MARPQNRKRRHTDEPVQSARPPKRVKSAGERDGLQERKRKCSDEPSQSSQPIKRVKLACDPTQDSPAAKNIKSQPNFPPQFWDNLSKIWLTRRALRELDRRNQANPVATKHPATGALPTSLARFARRGGPDLRHLRGYPEPKYVAKMSSNRSVGSSSRGTQSTKATTVSSKSKRSSAYDKDFEQKLIDNNIYPEAYAYPDDRSTPEPNNLENIVQGLSDPRASLSPSRFSPSSFRRFKQANSRVISEGTVMSDILPTIRGNADIPHEGDLRFTNINLMTNETTVNVRPDFYDGSYPQDIHRVVRHDLSKEIVPSSNGLAPVAPNFFLEGKPPSGGADVAKRQACIDGAYGARAMYVLQGYGETEPTYDGNAYTYSSTYHDGQLKLYAHHPTAPTATDGRPEYHMTQLKGYALTSDRETFVAGATAFRNARELAERHRRSFIRAANARASKSGVLVEEPDEDPTYDDPDASINYTYWQGADDALQQQIAASSNYAADDDTTEGIIPPYLYPEDDSQSLSQGPTALGFEDPSMSFTSSFTSVSTERARSKRPRQSDSPPSKSKKEHASTNRSRRNNSLPVLDKSALETGQSSSNQSHWVETYDLKGRICFRNPEGQEVKTELKEWAEQMLDGTACFYWKSAKSGRAFWATNLPKAAKQGRQ